MDPTRFGEQGRPQPHYGPLSLKTPTVGTVYGLDSQQQDAMSNNRHYFREIWATYGHLDGLAQCDMSYGSSAVDKIDGHGGSEIFG